LIESNHYQIIWLLALGHTPLAVSQVTGNSHIWIYQLLRRYNQLGASALRDRRSSNRGQPPQLNDLQRAQLWQVLSGHPIEVYGMVAKSLIG
jgi:transposase